MSDNLKFTYTFKCCDKTVELDLAVKSIFECPKCSSKYSARIKSATSNEITLGVTKISDNKETENDT